MAVLLTFTRIYTHDLDATLAGLRRLGLPEPRLRFELPGAGVELAGTGANLVIAGTDAALAPYRDTMATFVVDDLEAAFTAGDTVVQEIQDVPTGRNATVRLGEVQVELVEWSPEQWARWEASERRSAD